MTKSVLIPRWLSGLIVAAALASTALAAAKPKLDPESAKFYQTARLIMNKQETKIFERLPDAASRQQFIADFWLKRDPDPDTPANEYKEQFEARVALVNKRFGNEGGPGYNTDRGRVFIFMGPPNRIEETPSGADGTSVIWWTYYDRRMAVGFANERGSNRYRISSVEGDFFEAMDLAKLGNDVRTDEVFSEKFVKFAAAYDPAAGEIEVRLPTKALMFRENDEGKFQIDLRFLIYIYPDQGAGKESFADARTVVMSGQDLNSAKTVSLRFARVLKPGTSFVDVLVMGREGRNGKIRQMFEIKVPRS